MSDKLNSIYNTGCAPRNVFFVWSTLTIVSVVIALYQVWRNKRTIGLEPAVTLTELAVALVISIALVVAISYILKALCTTEIGWWFGFVVVAILVVLTSYGSADFYTNQLTVREVKIARRVKEQLPMLRARFSRNAKPAQVMPMAASSTSSDLALLPTGNSPTPPSPRPAYF